MIRPSSTHIGVTLCVILSPFLRAESDISKMSPFNIYAEMDVAKDCSRMFELGSVLITEAAKPDGIHSFAEAGYRGVWNACIQARKEKKWNSTWANRVIELPLPGPDVSADNALKYVVFSGLALSEVWGARMEDKKRKLEYDYTEPLRRFEQLAQLLSGLKDREGAGDISRTQIIKLREGVDRQIANVKDVITARAKLAGSRPSAASPTSNGSTTAPSAKSGSDTKTSVTKTYTVTSDARANQTGDEAGASGESSVTIRGDGGTFTVRYWYDWPSSYLISAGRGKSLEGKSVSVQFEGDKATYISCGSGSGRCQIKSFSQQ